MLNGTQNNRIIIGIDVSKDKLDICLLPSKHHVVIQNDKKSISLFIKRFIEEHSIEQVKIAVMEATGGYERLVAKLLRQANLPIHIAHPNQVYHFAKSKRLFAKTDKIDANILACFGLEMDITPTVLPSQDEQELKELATRQMQLKEMLTTEKCRLKEHLTAEAKKSINRFINQIEREIELLNGKIKTHVEKDPEKKERAACLKTFKGVGEQTAHMIVAGLPELGKLSRNEIGALVGLAPKNHDSGTKSGYRAIHGGRFYIRKTLYMPALSAIRHNNVLKAYYQKLIGKGKKEKVAIVAVMRKIIVTLNAMLKNNESWKQAYCKNTSCFNA